MAINSLSASSKGISGLASGMDTQSMVDQMLKGTQAKIDKKNQEKSVLTFKQDMYRSIATQIRAFQQQFFSFSSPATNLMSTGLFQTMNAVTQSKFLTATASSSASPGRVTINEIKSLARNHREVAKETATGELSGKFSTDAIKKLTDKLTDATASKISIKVGEGDTAKTVDIALKDIAGKSTPDAVKVFNEAFKAAGVNSTADFVEGKIVFTNTDNLAMNITTGENAATSIGAVVATGNQLEFSLDTKAALPKINVNVDGITKSISFNPLELQGTEQEKQAALVGQLNAGLKSSFGAGIRFEGDANGKVTLKVDNASSKVVLTGDTDVMNVIGIKSNLSNKISTTKGLSDVNFKTPLSGNMQKFSINGVDFSFSNSTSISNIIAKVNSSDAGVRMSYDSVRDRFMIESTTSGKLENGANGSPFELKQTEGNLLTVMFGVNPSDTYSSAGLKFGDMRTTTTFDTANFKFESDSFKFKVMENGVEKAYTISGIKNEGATPQEIIDDLNLKIAATDGLKDENGNAKIKFELKDLGGGKSEISLVTSDPDKIKANVVGEGLSAFGFTEKISGSTLMSELGFEDFTFEANGKTVSVSANTTLNDFMNTLKTESGADVTLETIGSTPFIRLAGVSIPMTFSVPAASKLFGGNIQAGDGKVPSTGVFSKDPAHGYVEGVNAEAVINGETVIRSTNNFTIDGVNLTLTGVTTEEQVVDVSQDTEVVYDAVKKFVDEYNKLVNSINGLIDADVTYRKYPPLTTEQKKEMSDKEIELWEEKAKGGLLRGDSTLVGIQSSLRSVIYTKPDPSGLALYDLGITTDYFGTKDNLAIGDEKELKAKIAENPDAVRELFTNAEKGLSTLLNNAMDKAASSGSRPGSLVQVAGSAGKVDTSSSIYRQMKSIDDSLDRLELKYEQEYNRYWKQFNAMEQQLAQMNQQSGWLAQQFA